MGRNGLYSLDSGQEKVVGRFAHGNEYSRSVKCGGSGGRGDFFFFYFV